MECRKRVPTRHACTAYTCDMQSTRQHVMHRKVKNSCRCTYFEAHQWLEELQWTLVHHARQCTTQHLCCWLWHYELIAAASCAELPTNHLLYRPQICGAKQDCVKA